MAHTQHHYNNIKKWKIVTQKIQLRKLIEIMEINLVMITEKRNVQKEVRKNS